ncbi:MAG: acetate/propionate family kinase [Jatrophihabitans sp.]|nr:MAG: acetate/propionate family kinase [Jatrophihabitans sp.]
MRVLVVNAGSSSLKLRLLDGADTVAETADLPADAGGFDTGAVRATVGEWPPPDRVGHRVVHGGTEFTGAVLVDPEVTARVRALADLAPLHQRKSLAGLAAVTQALPAVPAVACFDTAFHRTLPPEVSTYPVPASWRRRWGVRRYGFHGLSHAYASRRALELTGLARDGSRVVTCHLGAGASLCAVRDGCSVDTTMGFTPLDGLVMATRSGSLDPGLVLWLEEHEGLRPAQVALALEERSGLFALAGTGDMREVERRAADGDEDARLALQVYAHRLAAGVAAMAAALGGMDVLVFTGGVGENSARVRAEAGARLGWLGVGVDPEQNAGTAPDAEITGRGAAVRTLVIEAREDLQIAAEVRAVAIG